ncbi:MAG: HAMP domain-containing sensor histidine kinase [Bacillota bacterium]|nr:HAMP domain-containing sensor histidine kinase [Bacillota bacterium]
MTIRHKLILYFGILLAICFAIAGMLSGFFLRSASNRLLFANVKTMNDSISASVSIDTEASMIDDMIDIKTITGVETILFKDDVVIAATFAGDLPTLTGASVVSETYGVRGVRTGTMYYYFTITQLTDDGYTLYVFRSEDLAVDGGEGMFYAAFVGVLFLFISISLISVFAARVFANPIRDLAGYANRMDPERKPEPRPVFDIAEFNELGSALEKASIRLNDYRTSEREFLHNFSHEMKTPLTNIYGYAEGLDVGVLQGEEAQNACKVIMTESEKLKDNINQILFLGRLDAVETVYKMQKTNLSDVIADAMNSVQIAAHEANVELRLHPIAAESYLTADAEKLEAAFVNVLSNGVRYAKTAIDIDVSVEADRILVTVDDDGPGIPLTDRERVFERYFIGYKGHTGLGLTIARAIVVAHGGKITASASPAHGARFTFEIPKRT